MTNINRQTKYKARAKIERASINDINREIKKPHHVVFKDLYKRKGEKIQKKKTLLFFAN